MRHKEEATIGRDGLIRARRQAAAVVFGLAYGGAFVNGVYKGLAYALRIDEDALVDSPILTLVVEVFAAVAISFLAGYVSRRVIVGIVAGALGSTLILSMPTIFSVTGDPPSGRWTGAALAFALAVPAAFYSSRCPVEEDDISKGRVIGVSWRHWLWLWLPWQYMVANAVWLGTPRFLVLGIGGWVLSDILRSGIAAGVAVLATFKAVQAIREDAPLTRTQAFVRFVGWFLLVPILVNLWRMLL